MDMKIIELLMWPAVILGLGIILVFSKEMRDLLFKGFSAFWRYYTTRTKMLDRLERGVSELWRRYQEKKRIQTEDDGDSGLSINEPSQRQQQFRRGIAWGAFFGVIILLLILVGVFWKDTKVFGMPFKPGFLFLIPLYYFVKVTLKRPAVDAFRVLVRVLNKPSYEVFGPYPEFPGITSATLVSRRPKEAQQPADEDKIYRGNGPKPSDLDMVDPYRIIFLGKDGSEDILEQPGTYEFTGFYIYQIINAWRFIYMVGSEEELQTRLKDVLPTVLQGAASEKKTMKELINSWNIVNDDFLDTLNLRVEDWGIGIGFAKILPPDYGYHINLALKQFSAAIKASEQKIMERSAEAEGNRRIGFAGADIQAAEVGRVAKAFEEFKKIGIDLEVAMKMITIQKGLEGSDYSILSGSDPILNVLGAASVTPGLRELIMNKEKKS
ncbi:MAG: hypothetical protein HGB03_03930 [Candidatus Yonathbacteria bacterium]|nr:hypothetical protein [Candidatus Yonathbacteria bacterium]NTW47619.1 hypothetical protein [Candidatus Yonathbacteria bacterium]